MSTNARPIDVAAAAVTLLNSGPAQATFNQTFVAVRDYVPLFDLTAHKAGLKVTVIPAGLDESPMARLTIDGRVALDVGIQNWAPTLATKDGLMLLVEQIKTVMEKGLTLPEAAIDCGWLGTENDPIFRYDHIQQHNVFTSVPRFFYLTRRAR